MYHLSTLVVDIYVVRRTQCHDPVYCFMAAMTFVWPLMTSKGALIAISVIYGYVEYTHFL